MCDAISSCKCNTMQLNGKLHLDMACLQKRLLCNLAGLNSMLLASANTAQMSSIRQKAYYDEASKTMLSAHVKHL